MDNNNDNSSNSGSWILAGVPIIALVLFFSLWRWQCRNYRKRPAEVVDPFQIDIEQHARRNDGPEAPATSRLNHILPTAPTFHVFITSDISTETDQPPSYEEVQIQPNPPASLNECGFDIPPPQYPNCVLPQTHTGYPSR